VTVLPYDARITLCVTRPGDRLPESAACSITLTPQELPSSLRAYEVVDELMTTGEITGPPRAALERWRSVRTLDAFGDLALTPQVTRPLVRRGLPEASARPVTIVAWAYAGLLLFVALVLATTRFSASHAWLTFALVVVIGTAAAFNVGRTGPGRHITVHHTSLLQQIPGTDGGLLTMRAVAEFPADEDVVLRIPTDDAMVEASAASGRAQQTVDESGYPTLAVRAGLGSRQSFTTEAVTQARWLSVNDSGQTVRVSNQSTNPLHDCRFADGMSRTNVGDLPPGGTVEAVRQAEIAGPLFTCSTPGAAVGLTTSSRTVELIGTTTIAVYQHRTRPAGASEAPND
jgi:hypothetical protein